MLMRSLMSQKYFINLPNIKPKTLDFGLLLFWMYAKALKQDYLSSKLCNLDNSDTLSFSLCMHFLAKHCTYLCQPITSGKLDKLEIADSLFVICQFFKPSEEICQKSFYRIRLQRRYPLPVCGINFSTNKVCALGGTAPPLPSLQMEIKNIAENSFHLKKT